MCTLRVLWPLAQLWLPFRVPLTSLSSSLSLIKFWKDRPGDPQTLRADNLRLERARCPRFAVPGSTFAGPSFYMPH